MASKQRFVFVLLGQDDSIPMESDSIRTACNSIQPQAVDLMA